MSDSTLSAPSFTTITSTGGGIGGAVGSSSRWSRWMLVEEVVRWIIPAVLPVRETLQATSPLAQGANGGVGPAAGGPAHGTSGGGGGGGENGLTGGSGTSSAAGNGSEMEHNLQ